MLRRMVKSASFYPSTALYICSVLLVMALVDRQVTTVIALLLLAFMSGVAVLVSTVLEQRACIKQLALLLETSGVEPPPIAIRLARRTIRRRSGFPGREG